MGQISDFFVQSKLALAAYANLLPGSPSKTALVDAGMSDSQATVFQRDWTVVAQYTHSEEIPLYDDGGNITGYDTRTNGVSATVFEDRQSGQRHLAVRGTRLKGSASI